ncbi:MAG: hypothetical protein WA825_18425 [Steroidobacteraceae bacterium]
MNAAAQASPLNGICWALGWALVLFITYSTLAPGRYVPDLHINDKIEHATAFFGMTIWFGGLGRDMDINDWVADTCGVLIALGLLILVPRRRGSWLLWLETLIRR